MSVSVLVTILTITSLYCMAQGPNEVQYEVNYSYSRMDRGSRDSLFQITVSINEDQLQKLQRIYVKMGSKPGESDLFVTAIYASTLEKKEYDQTKDKEQLLSRRGDKIYIDLGIHPVVGNHILVKSKDTEDRYVRSRRKELSR